MRAQQCRSSTNENAGYISLWYIWAQVSGVSPQQQHQSAICSSESIQPILGWKQSAISEETRRCKWWVVSCDVKCEDYVNLISWYHDPEGQGFILEIIISIRTWHVVVWTRLIVFILSVEQCSPECWRLSQSGRPRCRGLFLGVATPVILCHKEPTRASKAY